MQTSVRWVSLLLLLICPFVANADDSVPFRKRLWSWMTSCCQSDELRSDCRKCVQEYFADHRQPEYGLQISSSLVDARTIKYDEIIDGKGDGLVAIESGRLSGVSDVIVGEFSHVDILSGSPSPAVLQVRNIVLARLR
ncbi:hypothetical protein ACFL2H_02050 [Planctomycetota bacterium]